MAEYWRKVGWVLEEGWLGTGEGWLGTGGRFAGYWRKVGWVLEEGCLGTGGRLAGYWRKFGEGCGQQQDTQQQRQYCHPCPSTHPVRSRPLPLPPYCIKCSNIGLGGAGALFSCIGHYLDNEVYSPFCWDFYSINQVKVIFT